MKFHMTLSALGVQFVLEPLYKIFSCVIGEEKLDIDKMLARFGVKLKAANYKKDIKPLLTDVCSAIFGQASGLTQMLVQHVPSSRQGAKTKVEHLYTGPPVCISLSYAKLSRIFAEWRRFQSTAEHGSMLCPSIGVTSVL